MNKTKKQNIVKKMTRSSTKRNVKSILTVQNKLEHSKDIRCPQPYLNIEKNYDKLFKNQNTKDYMKINKLLLRKLKIPFSPSTITPQSDFYSYINYRWLEETGKKYGSKKTKNRYFVEIDTFRLVQNKVYNELFQLIKNYLKKEKSKKRDAIYNVYHSLLHLNSKNTYMHIKKVNSIYEEHTLNQTTPWSVLSRLNDNEIISWGAPISWSVVEDPKNSEVFCNMINPPRLSLYDYLLYLGDYGQTDKYIEYKKSVVQHYIQYINEIFDKCLGKGHGLSGKDVFDVEVNLLTAMGCSEIKNDDPDGYNRVSVSESLEKYGFDWSEFAKGLGYKEVPSYFVCSNLNYLKCVCKYLNGIWRTNKFKAYALYVVLRQIIRFDSNLVDIYYNFNDKFIEGQPDPFPRELYPIFGLSLTFNTFLSEQYVNANWNTQNIEFIKNLADDLLIVFKRIIKRNTWLTPKTKEYALKKLDHLQLIMVKPDIMREDPILDYSPDDAWKNMLMITTWKKKKYLNLQGKEVIDIPLIDWKQFKLIGTQPYIVNAYYEMNKNKIFIPMAIMQKPFVNLEQRGFEYNLARMGYTLGHEMSHSLDNTGSKYDYKGNLYNWWTPEDKKKYNKIVKDIIKQYETFASYDGIKFNAEITVGEDMADISGMAICSEYLNDYFEVNQVIIPVRELSMKEFFIHYAYHQRQHIYKRAVNAQLGTNPHPLDKYRTNCVLSRLDLFRSMFNIKKGDKMWWPINNYNSRIWS